MAGISIGIAADTRAFASGVRSGVLQPLDQVEDALQDVTREGEDANAELVGGFRGAQRATKDLEDANKELADTIRAESRKSSRAVKDIGDDGFSKASDSVDEFKSEAISNFSEVASSFSGDITEMADGVQGLTGGLASALTPGIGIPVAILGAAAGAFLASWQQTAEETETRISDMYRDMTESGQAFLSEGFIQSAITDLADDTGKWNEALKQQEELGLSVQTIMRAMVGDQDAINSVIDATNQKREEELRGLESLDPATQDYADKVDAVNVKADATIEKWRAIQAETDTAAAKAGAVRGAFEGGNAVLDAGLRKLQDMRAELDKLGTGRSIRLDVIPDMSAFERAIGLQEGRTITINVNGEITRIGNQVR